MRRFVTTGLFAAGLALSGCANMTPEERETLGTTVGAVVGGAVGSQIGGDTTARVVAGVVGSVIGGFIGHKIAEHVNEQEAEEIAAAQRAALASPPAKTAQRNWESKNKKKKATVKAAPAKTKQAVVAEDKSEKRMRNLSDGFDDLPEDTACRETTTTLNADGTTVTDTALYCQGQGGDYVRVADLDRA